MIDIGDNITWDNLGWKVYHIDKENHTVRLQRVEDGTGIATVVDLRVLESDYYKQLYENEKQRADELEQKGRETSVIAIDRLIKISDFKKFICESIDIAKEDYKNTKDVKDYIWLKALQYVYLYTISNAEK